MISRKNYEEAVILRVGGQKRREVFMPDVEIKRLKDGMYSDPKTGWSAYPFIYGFDADLRGVHVVSIYPGQVRGNHFHEKTNELLFFFAGKGVFYWEEEGSLREHMMTGSPTVIRIRAGVKHAFKNTGEGPVYLLALRDGEFDPRSPDVVKAEIAAP